MDNMSKIIFFCLAVITTLLIYQNNQLKENIDLVNEQIETLTERTENTESRIGTALMLGMDNQKNIGELINWGATDLEYITENSKEIEKLDKKLGQLKNNVEFLRLDVDDLVLLYMDNME
tara:strand:- start:200 stop:559 length:360 start_codon:yes stop_codon:yes gene_type:complete